MLQSYLVAHQLASTCLFCALMAQKKITYSALFITMKTRNFFRLVKDKNTGGILLKNQSKNFVYHVHNYANYFRAKTTKYHNLHGLNLFGRLLKFILNKK